MSSFFTLPSFSNQVNPNLVGCRLHIVQEIAACVECAKLVYSYFVTSLALQSSARHLTLLASFSPPVYSEN